MRPIPLTAKSTATEPESVVWDLVGVSPGQAEAVPGGVAAPPGPADKEVLAGKSSSHPFPLGF